MTPTVIRALELAGIARTESDEAAGWALAIRCESPARWRSEALREASRPLALALVANHTAEAEIAAHAMLDCRDDVEGPRDRRRVRAVVPAPRGPTHGRKLVVRRGR